MDNELLASVVVQPSETAKASVIWLHGLGADGYNFESVVPEIALPEWFPVRFIFPHAPYRPVTINGGMVMRSWFDMYGMLPEPDVNEGHVEESVQFIDSLVRKEMHLGVPSDKIVLAGFSQGGSIALHAGLSSSLPLGGILGLSTFLPEHPEPEKQYHAANYQTPIMLMHGSEDMVISSHLGLSTRSHLKQKAYNVEWNEYSMGHEVCTEELSHISLWLQKVLK